MKEMMFGNLSLVATKESGMGIVGTFSCNVPLSAAKSFHEGNLHDLQKQLLVLESGFEKNKSIWNAKEINSMDLTEFQKMEFIKFMEKKS